MPAEAAKAMPLLERALTLEPDYAGAHGYLAWCHQILFVFGGFNKESHDAAIRHARAALSYGRDDATALALGGFVISITEHDHATAFDALEQALAISPSSSFALFCGSLALAYAGEAERGIVGVYGDSAIEDMQVLAEKFGVNLSNFDFDRYFPPQFEGRNRFEMVLINSLPFVSKIVRDRREYLPVTLAMIDQSLREKTWPADDLTQV
jgi:tetratricopeptide (TPR) repeat protein